MKCTKCVGLLLAAALTLANVGVSHAAWRGAKNGASKKGSRAVHNTFSVSGEFTGSLEGQIVVGKSKVSLTDKTSIYVVGEGARNDNPFVSRASVYVGGVMKDGKRQAAFVVVRTTRPMSAIHGGQNPDSGHSIRSEVNTNVGQWAEGYE